MKKYFLIFLCLLLSVSCSDENIINDRSEFTQTEADGFGFEQITTDNADSKLMLVLKMADNIFEQLDKPCSVHNGEKLCIGDKFYQKIHIHTGQESYDFDQDFNFLGDGRVPIDFKAEIDCVKKGASYLDLENNFAQAMINQCLPDGTRPRLDSLYRGEITSIESFISQKLQVDAPVLGGSKASIMIHYTSEAGHVYLVNPCQVVNHNADVRCLLKAKEAYILASYYDRYVDENAGDWNTLSKVEKQNIIANYATKIAGSLSLILPSLLFFGLTVEWALPALLVGMGFTEATAASIVSSLGFGFGGQMAASATFDLSESFKRHKRCQGNLRCKLDEDLNMAGDVLAILMSALPMSGFHAKLTDILTLDAVESLTLDVYLSSVDNKSVLSDLLRRSDFLDSKLSPEEKKLALLAAINEGIKTKVLRLHNLRNQARKVRLSKLLTAGRNEGESVADFIARIDKGISDAERYEGSLSSEDKNCPNLNLTCPMGSKTKTIAIKYTPMEDAQAIADEYTSNFRAVHNRFIPQGTPSPFGSKIIIRYGTVLRLDGVFEMRVYPASSLSDEELQLVQNDAFIIKKLAPSNMAGNYEQTMIQQPLTITSKGTKLIRQKLSPITRAHMKGQGFDLNILHQQLFSMAQTIEFLHTPTLIDGEYQIVAHRDIKLGNMLQQSPDDYRAAITGFAYSERFAANGYLTVMNGLDNKFKPRVVGSAKTMDPSLLETSWMKAARKNFTFSKLLAADIWSLGITMLELSFGERLFFSEILDIGRPGDAYHIYSQEGIIDTRIKAYFKQSDEVIMRKNRLTEEQVAGMRDFIRSKDYQVIVKQMLKTKPNNRSTISQIISALENN